MSNMNFHYFKERISQLIETEDGFDEEWFHDWYVAFKDTIHYPDVDAFANDWFQDINLNTHPYQLKER